MPDTGPQFAMDSFKISSHLKSHLAGIVRLHESHTLSVMHACTEDDRLLHILLPPIDGSTTCPLCPNTTFNDIGLLHHHFEITTKQYQFCMSNFNIWKTLSGKKRPLEIGPLKHSSHEHLLLNTGHGIILTWLHPLQVSLPHLRTFRHWHSYQ